MPGLMISPATGALTFLGGAGLTAGTTYQLTLGVSDQFSTATTLVAIAVVAPPNRSPSFAAPNFSLALPADAAPNAVVGTVLATDPDGDPLTYTLVGGSSLFDLAPATGQLTYLGGPTLTPGDSFSLTLQVTDGHLTDSVPLTITVGAATGSGTSNGSGSGSGGTSNGSGSGGSNNTGNTGNTGAANALTSALDAYLQAIKAHQDAETLADQQGLDDYNTAIEAAIAAEDKADKAAIAQFDTAVQQALDTADAADQQAIDTFNTNAKQAADKADAADKAAVDQFNLDAKQTIDKSAADDKQSQDAYELVTKAADDKESKAVALANAALASVAATAETTYNAAVDAANSAYQSALNAWIQAGSSPASMAYLPFNPFADAQYVADMASVNQQVGQLLSSAETQYQSDLTQAKQTYDSGMAPLDTTYNGAIATSKADYAQAALGLETTYDTKVANNLAIELQAKDAAQQVMNGKLAANQKAYETATKLPMTVYSQEIDDNRADYDQSAAPILAVWQQSMTNNKTTYETMDTPLRATLKVARDAYNAVINDKNSTVAQIGVANSTLNVAIADFLVADVAALSTRDLADALAQNAAAQQLNQFAVLEAIANSQAAADEAYALNAAVEKRTKDDVAAELDYEMSISAAVEQFNVNNSQAGNDYLHGVNAAAKVRAETDNKAQHDWVHGWSALQSAYSEAFAWAEARRTNAKDQAQSLLEVGTELAKAAAMNRWALALNSFQATKEAALEQASATKLATIAPLQLAANKAKSDGDAQWVTDVKQGWITGTNALADHLQSSGDALSQLMQQLFDKSADDGKDFEQTFSQEIVDLRNAAFEDQHDLEVAVAEAKKTSSDQIVDALTTAEQAGINARSQLVTQTLANQTAGVVAENQILTSTITQVGNAIQNQPASAGVPFYVPGFHGLGAMLAAAVFTNVPLNPGPNAAPSQLNGIEAEPAGNGRWYLFDANHQEIGVYDPSTGMVTRNLFNNGRVEVWKLSLSRVREIIADTAADPELAAITWDDYFMFNGTEVPQIRETSPELGDLPVIRLAPGVWQVWDKQGNLIGVYDQNTGQVTRIVSPNNSLQFVPGPYSLQVTTVVAMTNRWFGGAPENADEWDTEFAQAGRYIGSPESIDDAELGAGTMAGHIGTQYNPNVNQLAAAAMVPGIVLRMLQSVVVQAVVEYAGGRLASYTMTRAGELVVDLVDGRRLVISARVFREWHKQLRRSGGTKKAVGEMAQQIDDDVARLVGNGGYVSGWRSSQTNITDVNSKILRKNMGLRRNSGTQAHHIVPSTDLDAAPARAILDHYQIDINSAVNGVELTKLQHDTSGLHVGPNINRVTQRLDAAVKGVKEWAKARQAIIDELAAIGDEILSGNFP